MRKFTLFIIAFIVWVLLTWPFDAEVKRGAYGLDWQSIGIGIIVAILTTLIFGETFTQHPGKLFNPVRYFWFIYYIPVFFYYMMLANFDVLYRVLHPCMPIRPGIVKVKTKLKSKSGLTVLCNSITLTPGTLTVDLTEDGYLYIHWINVCSDDIESASRIIVAKFENILKKIFE